MVACSINEAQELFAAFFAIYFALIIDRAYEHYNAYRHLQRLET